MEKTCKKCGKILPEGYKYRCCENCRNEKVQKAKDIGKGVLGVVIFFGGIAVTVATKGKINPNDKA